MNFARNIEMGTATVGAVGNVAGGLLLLSWIVLLARLTGRRTIPTGQGRRAASTDPAIKETEMGDKGPGSKSKGKKKKGTKKAK